MGHQLAVRRALLALALATGCVRADPPELWAPAEWSPRDDQVDRYVESANQALSKGHIERAIRIAETILADHPGQPDAHAIIGAARWRSGDFDGAVAAWGQARESDPRSYGATLGLAGAMQAAGDHRRALKLMDALLREDRRDIQPRLVKLSSLYATARFEHAAVELDFVFRHLSPHDPFMPWIRVLEEFIRPFVGMGPLCRVVGESGTAALSVQHEIGLRLGRATVGGKATAVGFVETIDASIIDRRFVDELGLKSLGTIPRPGTGGRADVVLVPLVEFGDIAVASVPARVEALDGYAPLLGTTPGLLLGRQAMQAFGTIRFDFPDRAVTLTRGAPTNAPEGAADLPLRLLGTLGYNIPTIPIHVDGSGRELHVVLGSGTSTADDGLTLTRRAYMVSGHPQGELPPRPLGDGPVAVSIRDVALGNMHSGPTRGLLIADTAAEPTLRVASESIGFELGGAIHSRLLTSWVVTYVFGTGRLYIEDR